MASSPYAMKNIYQLHELYGKHVNKFVANIEWLDEERNIFSCDCGAFIDVVVSQKKAITAACLNKPGYARKVFKKVKNKEIRKKFLRFYLAQTGKRFSPA